MNSGIGTQTLPTRCRKWLGADNRQSPRYKWGRSHLRGIDSLGFVTEPTCTHCKSGDLYPGFLGDYGQGSAGFVRWVEGALERGMLGGAKIMGKPKWEIDAYRCQSCGHIELFAVRPD